MKKYAETARVLFKTQLAYRFDIVVSMIFTVSKILLAYVLWSAIFDKRQEVSGFTFGSMLSYYIISSFLTQLDQSTGTGWQIADEIRNGRFSKYIVRPMNILGYFTSQTAGVSAFLLSFNLIAAVIWVLLFRVPLVLTGQTGTIAAACILVVLGLLFMMQLNYFIGILAFKFLDTSIFMMIKDNITEFVRGSFIPLILLPAGIVKGMMFFPFYHMSYLPTMLLLGKNTEEAAMGIMVLFLWNAAFLFLNTITFKRLKEKYDGTGI